MLLDADGFARLVVNEIEVGQWDNFVVNAEIGIEVAINAKWSLKTYLQDTYDNEPAAGRKKNDLKLVSGIAYKF